MKTKVFLVALVLGFGSTFVNAQYHDRRVNFAISLGPQVNWIHADEPHLSTGPIRMGIGAGLRLDYKLQRFYALSFGVNLIQTGGNVIYNEPLYLDLTSGMDTLLQGTKVTYRLQYVEIPFALKILLPEIGYSTWYFEAGLDPMFNTQAFINTTDNNIEKEPFRQGVSPFNLAWHTGLGLNYSLGGSVCLQFTLFYMNSFLDVTRENDIRKPDNSRINQVGLNFGILF